MLTNQNEKISIFNSDQFGQIRSTIKDGEPMFCLADVCKSLNLQNPSMIAKRLEDDLKQTYPISDSLGREQATTFVSEAGLYEVVLRSDSPQARPFRRWLTTEVLPSIRKSGGYMVSVPNESPEETMARALVIAQNTIDRQKQEIELHKLAIDSQNTQIAILEAMSDTYKEINDNQKIEINELKPKAMFANAMECSDNSILVGELAKLLRQNGVEMGQNRLFKWLRENGFLCSKGEAYNQPTQKSLEMGLFEIKKTMLLKSNGDTFVTTTPKVTGKGQVFFVNKFLSN